MRHLTWGVQKPGWWMISWEIILPLIYWGLFHNPIGESRSQPTRIQWNKKGILNTAHLGLV